MTNTMDAKETSKYRFSFKPATLSQKELIHTWLAQPYIKEWIHGQGLQNVFEDLDNFFESKSWGVHWIAYDQNTPLAYLLTSTNDAESLNLDVFICDLNYLGKGLAVQLVREFLLSMFPNMKKILIDPEATNARAIHVYKKIGFKIVKEFIAKWHPVPHYQMELDVQKLKTY